MKSILHIIGPVHNGRQSCSRCHALLSKGPAFWPEHKILKSSTRGMVVVDWKETTPGARACGPTVSKSGFMAARVREAEGRG